jgi:hypothetical protein
MDSSTEEDTSNAKKNTGQKQAVKGAKFVLFGIGQGNDARYLDLWRNAPLTYTPGQPIDATWHIDHHEDVIAPDCTPELFERAGDLLLRYQFYPPSLMHHVSDFSRENRHMRPGDRIVQRIHGFPVFGFPLVDGITMNEVIKVIDEPRRKGFTYVTTAAHVELGEWSAQVEWRDDGALVLTIDATARLAYHMPRIMIPHARKRQLRAHDLGMEAFKNAVLAG